MGVVVDAVSEGLEVRWEPVPGNRGNTNFSYVVQWKSGSEKFSGETADGRQEPADLTDATTYITDTRYTIKPTTDDDADNSPGLSPAREYTVQVFATNRNRERGPTRTNPPAATGNPQMRNPPRRSRAGRVPFRWMVVPSSSG